MIKCTINKIALRIKIYMAMIGNKFLENNKKTRNTFMQHLQQIIGKDTCIIFIY